MQPACATDFGLPSEQRLPAEDAMTAQQQGFRASQGVRSAWALRIPAGACAIMRAAIQRRSVAAEVIKRVNVLRLLRVARIFRVAKILRRFPVLMNFIGGFVGAMQAMFWGLVLILILLVMWSLMAVELIYPESQKLTWAEDAAGALRR